MDLIHLEKRVTGALAYDWAEGKIVSFQAGAVVLACGGGQQLFSLIPHLTICAEMVFHLLTGAGPDWWTWNLFRNVSDGDYLAFGSARCPADVGNIASGKGLNW